MSAPEDSVNAKEAKVGVLRHECLHVEQPILATLGPSNCLRLKSSSSNGSAAPNEKHLITSRRPSDARHIVANALDNAALVSDEDLARLLDCSHKAYTKS